jgi:hypothetical protein
VPLPSELIRHQVREHCDAHSDGPSPREENSLNAASAASLLTAPASAN